VQSITVAHQRLHLLPGELESEMAIITGTERNDVIVGLNESGDEIYGLGGNDSITGLSGSDALFGGNGHDTLYGSAGNDMLDGGAGADRLYGGAGNDTLRPDSGALDNDRIDGGDGIDTIDYSTAPVTRGVRIDLRLTGAQDTLGAGKDTILSVENILGTRYADTLNGSNGANLLDGGMGNDKLYGNAGSDTLYGRNGNDLLDGGTDDDLLDGGAGDDTAYGGLGDDNIVADSDSMGNDVFDGGGGIDMVRYYRAAMASGVTVDLNITAAQNTGGGGVDTFRNIEGVEGSDFADLLMGDANDNFFSAGAGNDSVYGGNGNDRIYAGFGDGGTTNYIDGGNGDDILEGSGGADTIIGGAGNDLFRPSIDRDVMEGGAGADVFWFRDGDSFTLNGLVSDVIRDYNAAEDDIQIFTNSWEAAPTLQSIVDLGDGGQRASLVFAGHGGVATLFIDVYGSPITAADFTFTSTDPFML
jgi:Ca2+-binding RTX toxin-like protein